MAVAPDREALIVAGTLLLGLGSGFLLARRDPALLKERLVEHVLAVELRARWYLGEKRTGAVSDYVEWRVESPPKRPGPYRLSGA